MKLSGRAHWYACWKQNGKPVRKSTGIPLEEHGKSAKQLRRTAEMQAEAMERLAKGRCTLDEAQDALRAVAVANGISKAVPSVIELLDSVPRDSRESSEQNRARAHKAFIGFLGKRATERVDMVTEEDCRAFVRCSLDRVACGTVEGYRVYLRLAFQKGVRDGFFSRNPWEGVSVKKMAKVAGIKTRSIIRVPFTKQEMDTIIMKFPEPWCDMAAISLFCRGLRISDVCLMKWGYVDFSRGWINLPHEKKTNEERDFPITGYLQEVMERRRAKALPGDEYIFPLMAERYKHSPGYASTQFTGLLKAFGIVGETADDYAACGRKNQSCKTFHSIRHTARSGFGADPNITQDEACALVGHKDKDVSAGYFHIAEEKQIYAVKSLEAWLWGDQTAGADINARA